MGFWANLFGSGSSSSSVSSDGAFLWLCASGSAEAVKNAIASGKNANEKDKDGKTALMYAAETNRDEEVLRVLINAGANVSARNNKGTTALHFAAVNKSCNPKIIDVLTEAGIDVNVRHNAMGQKGMQENITPLMDAAGVTFDNSRNIKALVNAGADVNAICVERINHGRDISTYRNTVLIIAIRSNNAENVRAVIEAGADVNEKISLEAEISGRFVTGYSFPLIAAIARRTEILKLLLDAGADVNARTNDGDTALGFAEDLVPGLSGTGNAEAARILKARGAIL